jgi:hypothetical protein
MLARTLAVAALFLASASARVPVHRRRAPSSAMRPAARRVS